MSLVNQSIIRHKMGLLNLAEELRTLALLSSSNHPALNYTVNEGRGGQQFQ